MFLLPRRSTIILQNVGLADKKQEKVCGFFSSHPEVTAVRALMDVHTDVYIMCAETWMPSKISCLPPRCTSGHMFCDSVLKCSLRGFLSARVMFHDRGVSIVGCFSGFCVPKTHWNSWCSAQNCDYFLIICKGRAAGSKCTQNVKTANLSALSPILYVKPASV